MAAILSQMEREHILARRLCNYLSLNGKGNTHLYNGELSHVIFLFYYGLLTGDDHIRNRAVCNLEYHLDIAQNQLLNYKFAYGVTGIAWLTQFLVNRSVLDEASASSFKSLDTYIYKSLKWNFEDALYDLFIGSIGKGLYFFERLEYDPGNILAKNALSAIVQNLDQIAVKTAKTACWLDEYTSGYSDHRTGSPYYGIGISHGIPSVIIFLCFCLKKKIEPGIAGRLAEQACNWLLNQEEGNHHYPSTVYPDGERNRETTSLSWCYGILSVAWSLMATGIVLGNEVFRQKAKAILDFAATIRPEESCIERNDYGYDIFFCHGTSGISYLFQKMYLLTEMPKLKTAADQWFDLTCKEIQKYPGHVLKYNNSLLTGSCGVAMVTAARIRTDVMPGWDKMFLLNIEDLIVE